MAADPELVERLRAVFGGEAAEKAMFGGVAFLVDGHMVVAAGSRGDLMVRCDPEDVAVLTAQPGVEPMQMRGRPMTGWMTVDPSVLTGDDDLTTWVASGRRRVADLDGTSPRSAG